jgi:CRISPR system Cascade subunit CasB
MPDAPDRTWIPSFIDALHRLVDRDDRATLASLRRGLGRRVGECVQRDAWVYQHLRGAAAGEEEPAALVASLFALHPSTSGRSLGEAFATVLENDRENSSVEKRFVAVLEAHPDDLPDRLRHAVTLLKARDLPIDYGLLLLDLLDWNRERRPVQRRWSREFWTLRESEPEPAADTHNTAEDPQPTFEKES